MEITRSSIDTVKGPGDWFTGDVYIDAVAAAPPPARVQANLVHFTPGARTAWHTHPLGQTIYVTEASGSARSATGRSRLSGPATVSSSRPTRTTGTAPRQAASWSTSRSTRSMMTTPPRSGGTR